MHTVIILLYPEAAHANLNGVILCAPRPGRGRMDFSYALVRLWERPAEELLAWAERGNVSAQLKNELTPFPHRFPTEAAGQAEMVEVAGQWQCARMWAKSSHGVAAG